MRNLGARVRETIYRVARVVWVMGRSVGLI